MIWVLDPRARHDSEGVDTNWSYMRLEDCSEIICPQFSDSFVLFSFLLLFAFDRFLAPFSLSPCLIEFFSDIIILFRFLLYYSAVLFPVEGYSKKYKKKRWDGWCCQVSFFVAPLLTIRVQATQPFVFIPFMLHHVSTKLFQEVIPLTSHDLSLVSTLNLILSDPTSQP